MRNRWLLSTLVLILTTLACTWTDIVPPAAPVIEPSSLPTFAISTLTLIPTETPLATLTSTPDAPVAWPKDLGINCRYGPGQEWEVISTILPDTMIEIKGRTVNTAWWYVSNPLSPNDFCWVAYDVVDTAGNLNTVPIVDPPVAAVTTVALEAVVDFTTCGEKNQVMFNGSLKANGPVTVTYHWEVSGDVQETFAEDTITIIQSGTQKVSTNTFSAGCGDYIVKLVATSPNETSVEKAFKIQAP